MDTAGGGNRDDQLVSGDGAVSTATATAAGVSADARHVGTAGRISGIGDGRGESGLLRRWAIGDVSVGDTLGAA